MLSIFEGAGVPQNVITRILVLSIVFAAIIIVANIVVLCSMKSSLSADELQTYLKISAFAFVLAGGILGYQFYTAYVASTQEVKELTLIMSNNECSGDFGGQFTSQEAVNNAQTAQLYSQIGFFTSVAILGTAFLQGILCLIWDSKVQYLSSNPYA
jgi:hypothetical protein